MFGFLNLYKPEGLTSRDVVNRVYRLAKPAKCGHAGTLDPMATGVLLVCVGPATRLISWLQDRRKTYVAQFLLGQTSDTDDSTGQVTIHETCRPVSVESIEAALKDQTGLITQVPPAFSAVHVSGQRAYDLARRGEHVELQPRQVEVYRIEVLRFDWPVLELKIECGSGTYIRSIARDLGRTLGCGALMSRLERTSIGEFHSQNALLLDELTPQVLREHLQPAASIVSHLPRYVCTDQDRFDLNCGRTILASKPSADASGEEQTLGTSEWTTGGQAALVDSSGLLLAIAEVLNDAVLQPRLVFK